MQRNNYFEQLSEGHLELILGGMFGGKTSKLLGRLNRFTFQGREVKLFSPEIDTRYSQNFVISHDGLKRECVKITDSEQILDYINKNPLTEIIGIDEGQMMDEDLPKIIDTLTDKGKTIIVSALIYDFRAKLFPFRKKGYIEQDSNKNIGELIKRTVFTDYHPSYCMEELNGKMCCKDTFLNQRYMSSGLIAPKNDPTIRIGTSEKDKFDRIYKSKCWKHFVDYK